MPTNYFYPHDAAAIMTSLVKQLAAESNITKVDSNNFVDAGHTVMEAGLEKVMNAISVLITRTIVASRPYNGKFGLVAKDVDAFSDRFRKISFYSKKPMESGMFNTDENTNIGTGLGENAGAGSQWEQNLSMPLEMNFFSEFAWDYEYTDVVKQLELAFESEGALVAFLNGARQQFINDLEQQLEAKNRLLVMSRMAGIKLLADSGVLGAECSVNLTKEFNSTYGTSYTTAQLLHEHRVSFLEFFLARIKNDSDMMENRTAMFHDPMVKTVSDVPYYILRHTPKADQRMIYNKRLFTEIKLSLAEIFNPDMLAGPDGEGVQYWQSTQSPYSIDVVPTLPDNATSSEVSIDVCVALLYDKDGLMSSNSYKGMLSTPIHARKGIRNEFYHMLYSLCNDFTENSILYYMSDNSTEYFTGDGTEDDFVLTGTATTIVSVKVDGVAQTSGTDYTFADNTITFAAGHIPASGKVIQVIYK